MDINREGVSAILIVYHEEQVVERCLKSLVGVVDEIIVIHDGECQDKTLEIAKKYTDKIFVKPHKGRCSLHMIDAVNYATYSWILRVDADEFLSSELRDAIGVLIKKDEIDAFSFIWPLWDGKQYISKGFPYRQVLHKKDKIAFAEFPNRGYSTWGVIKKVPLILEHRPRYNNYTYRTFKSKWIQWTKSQAEKTLNHRITRFLNYSYKQKVEFHKHMDRQIQFAHPVLIFFWFAFSFSKYFFIFCMWRNPHLWKIAFFQGLYSAYLCYHIWLGKKG